MFTETIIETIVRFALAAGISPAALLALVEIESGGQVFAKVNGEDKPLIRFEGHYFDKRLGGAKRDEARRRKLAAPVSGVVANPRSQEARWAMLAKARAIDPAAASESVSWGIGQVMGAHWNWLGYTSVDALVAEATEGLEGQLRLMLRFVEKSGIMPHLKARNWQKVARIYNGPGFARYQYDKKLAAAEARWSNRLLKTGPVSAR